MQKQIRPSFNKKKKFKIEFFIIFQNKWRNAFEQKKQQQQQTDKTVENEDPFDYDPSNEEMITSNFLTSEAFPA